MHRYEETKKALGKALRLSTILLDELKNCSSNDARKDEIRMQLQQCAHLAEGLSITSSKQSSQKKTNPS
jgi:hypothetical protein